MQPNSGWSVSQFNANIALRHRLYVSGFLLSGVLKDIRSGVLEARVDLHYEDDIPVGVAVLITDGVPTNYLSSYYDLMIFVRTSYRNRGIGKKLIDEMKVSTSLKVGRGSRYSCNFWHSQGFTHMNNTNQLINIIISSFVTAFKNNRLNGLEFNFDFEPMKEVCAYFDAKPVGAYGCFTFELDGKTIFVYSTYGDSDAAEHDEEENEDGMVFGIVSMGFCFYLDKFIYCFDLDECGTIIRFFKTVQPFNGSPDMFTGKRPFYHYRDRQSLSMQGFDKDLNLDEHEEARKWTSGPRTQFNLEEFSIS